MVFIGKRVYINIFILGIFAFSLLINAITEQILMHW